jgi:hypothetical protein
VPKIHFGHLLPVKGDCLKNHWTRVKKREGRKKGYELIEKHSRIE